VAARGARTWVETVVNPSARLAAANQAKPAAQAAKQEIRRARFEAARAEPDPLGS
jgi:hypothetical protein